MSGEQLNKFCLLWEDLRPSLEDSLITVPEVTIISLVLMSQSIPHRIADVEESLSILVYNPYKDEACRQIRLYCAENSFESGTEYKESADPFATTMVVLYITFLTCIHVLSITFYPLLGLYPDKIESIGRLDSGRLISGEYWRAVTAVTMHADAAHLAGNALIGGIILSVLAQRVGAGYALFPGICCAVAANLINCFLHGSDFYAVGFSGAVFAATGMLAGYEAVSVGRKKSGKGFISIAAGLSLLAALGTGGENTDLAGHFLGFFIGSVTGVLMCSFHLSANHRGQFSNFVLYLISFVLPLSAWGIAFVVAG